LLGLLAWPIAGLALFGSPSVCIKLAKTPMHIPVVAAVVAVAVVDVVAVAAVDVVAAAAAVDVVVVAVVVVAAAAAVVVAVVAAAAAASTPSSEQHWIEDSAASAWVDLDDSLFDHC